ncbi:MAG TPA: SDR family NAD(P)-dependent oxidoreductase [Polyangiaceae bacterium]|jgi:NAD(P)-dependent dehydrogenase (short-subunit alcohol dehydrogenase family)|nr:SDR family NAD(P)-dependent oxidoreductase [Polyangiaceae bacterium]
MSGLSERHCVVTGVTSGIGLALAQKLVAAGASVTGLGRSEERLASLGAELGPAFSSLTVDLAVPAERARAAAELTRAGRAVDVFVSNAAEAAYEAPLAIAPETFRRLFEINVCAPLELCQALVPLLPPSGHVVQLSSVAARFVPNAKFGPYAVTKAAVTGLVDALRLELASRGLRVTSIAPGLVATPIYDDLPGFADVRRRLSEQVPDWLTPDDVADTILWVLTRPPNVVITELTVMPLGQAR